MKLSPLLHFPLLLLPCLLLAQDPFAEKPLGTISGRIDELVFAQLKAQGIEPSQSCSDVVFLRRAYIDIIGTLPKAQEVRTFLGDKNPDKREALVEVLLQRDEFADLWSNKWSDILRVKAEFPINLWPNAAQAYHRWLRNAVKDNMPYDQFVRELLVSNGSNFRVAQVNFYRALQDRSPKGIAQGVALSFMGVRADKWPAERLAGMSAFFSRLSYKSTAEWKEEIVYFDEDKTLANGGRAVFPDGTVVQLQPGRDPREAFAEWLTKPGNPWFAKAIANRVWSWLMGRGIVQEPDDMRPDNPPSNPALLDYLARHLEESHFDLRELYRVILKSKVYQFSSVPRSQSPEAAAQFAVYPVRRLDAEVLIDALNQITGTSEQYSSPIPEPFTFVPANSRAIALPDGSITSPFLEMFGRPARDTGLESERNNRFTPMQRLHLLNSTQVRRKIEQSPKIREMVRSSKAPRELINQLYLAILSRRPTEPELNKALSLRESRKDGRAAVNDLVWSLINSNEFLFRH